MFGSVISAAILGLEAYAVAVEADVSRGLPCFTIVGHASSQVRESMDRVRTSLKNSGFTLPPSRVTINLAPAGIPKAGAAFDLPIAAAILLAAGKIPAEAVDRVMVVGELGLEGLVRPVKGVLSMVCMGKKMGCRTCILPMGNRKEGMIIGGIKIIGVENLQQFIDLCLYGKEPEEEGRGKEVRESEHAEKADFADMLGQEEVKRAALIAAAGFHNLLMTGRPGGGKTMTAKRIPGILPPLTDEESLEVMQIHSIGGILDAEAGLVRQRPFRAPHYRLSAAALIGGGRIPQPGEVSLAHRGVLFLDELAEMGPGILENLRQPLEEKYVNISRLSGDYCFPADFLLVAAMNNATRKWIQ